VPRSSKADAAVDVDRPDVEGRHAELGDVTVRFETHRADTDPVALYAALPGGRCQAAHHGYVVAGRVVFRYADHDETYEAGDAYVAPPGHLPLRFAGTELVEFTVRSAVDPGGVSGCAGP
jgi:hypothetical protein